MSIDSTLGRRMAKALEARPEKQFVRVILPWIIALGGLIIYGTTLSHWVSLRNLTQVANVSGWGWQTEVYWPLNWLLTLPFRLLPARVVLSLADACCIRPVPTRFHARDRSDRGAAACLLAS